MSSFCPSKVNVYYKNNVRGISGGFCSQCSPVLCGQLRILFVINADQSVMVGTNL